ncbi:Vps51/Vps67-domain-containing protein [Crepidotus variabilis]|uniref:Vacuolar protein sorting-associated protein 51 homolog n=1 Tax=Crepidotus variabilis TaxID=179855 RepID=A0A9P6ES55_9AGAR|nr:Vps51/Vps67-domain-containing protein [Crepidotus variabilis]
MATAAKASIPRPPPSPLRTSSGASLPAMAAAVAGSSSNPASIQRAISTDSTTSSSGAPSRRASATGSALNVPVPGATSITPPTGIQKSRAKDLLRKHYGLGVGPPPPRPVGSNSQDPMDLNSSAFDAKTYYEQLITTSSLPSLLKRENELLSEIRELDGERQSLVYNHHHELIAASDTISAMKTRAESLDGDLDLLRSAFSEISRLTAEVSMEHVSKPKRSQPSGHRSSSRSK